MNHLSARVFKRLPIVLSLIAIGISCLGWWEAHRSRIVNEEINRPLLQASDVDFNQVLNTGYFFLSVRLKNIGKTTAKLSSCTFRQNITIYQGKVLTTCFIDDITFTYSGTEILPGEEKPLSGMGAIKSGCREPQTVFGEIRVEYDNPRTGLGLTQIFTNTFTPHR